MKRQILLGVAALFLLGQTLYAQQPSYKPGVVLVRFANVGTQPPGTTAKAGLVNDILKTSGSQVKREYSIVQGLSLVQLPAGVSVENAVASLKMSSSILQAEPDYIYQISLTPNDPRFNELWGMNNTGQNGGTPGADISAVEAWDIATGSSTIVVAVTDTGVDYTHPDLAANMWRNPGEIPGNGIDDDGNGYIDDVYGYDFVNNDSDPNDDHSHGTHVSGTIGAIGNNFQGVAGVCWNTRIMALKCFDANGFGSTSTEVGAIQYAISKQAKVINASWGGSGYSQLLYDTIAAARDAGIIFVAAAGNNGTNNDTLPFYPTSYDLGNIISVMAVDNTDTRSGFSNYGLTSVDLGAPGSNILSTFPGGNYGYMSGTSMASPHVAGACALLLSIDPSLNYTDVKKILLDTVDPTLSGLCVSGGRMNLAAAADEAAMDTTPPTPDPAVWQFPPQATGLHTISMEAGLGTDRSGVEYYFECVNDISKNSSWQANPLYSFTTLNSGTTYGFHFKARDLSQGNNETQWSTTLFATTASVSDNLPPAPNNPPQWAIKPKVQRVGSSYTIRMKAKGVDESGPVMFRFTGNKVPAGPPFFDSGWQTSDTSPNFTGVLGSTYQFQFQVMDAFGNTTVLSDSATITVATGSRIIPVPAQYGTIQAAIDAANPGDTVAVSPYPYPPYTYNGLGNFNISFRGKAITVRSIDPANPDIVAATVIDCQGTNNPNDPRRGFIFNSSEGNNSILAGFTIRNAYVKGAAGTVQPGSPDSRPGGDALGAGILCGNFNGIGIGGSPTIRNCVIESCVAEGGDGGVGADGNDGEDYVPGEGEPGDPNYVAPIEATPGQPGGDGGDNGFAAGGGIYCEYPSSSIIQNCIIRHCYVRAGTPGNGGNGGAGGTDPNTGQEAGGDGGDGGYNRSVAGGGIYVTSSGIPPIIGCTITDCNALNLTGVGTPGQGGAGVPPGNDGEGGLFYASVYGGGVYYNSGLAGANISSTTISLNQIFSPTLRNVDTNQLTYAQGGGIFLNSSGAYNAMTDCNITGNDANDGGGLGHWGGLILRNCNLINNNSTHSGGGSFSGSGNLEVYDSNFTDNTAIFGGGMYLQNTNPTIDRSTFTNNEASEGGGINGYNCNVTIKNSNINNNNAVAIEGVGQDGLGGGIGFWNTTGNIINCALMGNSADAFGGGAFITGFTSDSLKIDNCLITDNTALYQGGGISCSVSGWARLLNCTVVGNSATSRIYGTGGGVNAAEFYAYIQLVNSILWGNSATNGPQIGVGSIFGSSQEPGGPWADVDVDHSDVEGGEWAAFIEDPTYNAVWWLPGSFYDDPLFAETDVNQATYYLSHIAAGQMVDSPCIDRGDRAASSLELRVGSNLTTRTDQVRDAGTVDVGYHYIAGTTKRYKLTIEVRDTGFGANGRLLAEADGDNPFSIMDTNTIEVAQGTVADLTALAGPNFRVQLWQGSDDDASTAPTNTVTMNSDRTVVVAFEPDGLYFLTVTLIGGNGTVVPLGGSLRTPGEVVNLTAIPSNPSDVILWNGTDDDYSHLSTNTVTMTGHKNVTVRFYPPRILYVGADGDFETIQRAIEEASDGDIIMVQAGTYNIYESSEDLTRVTITDKAITITSVDPTHPEDTVINGGFLMLNVGRDTVLDGFTIQAGYGNPDGCPGQNEQCGNTLLDGSNGYPVVGAGLRLHNYYGSVNRGDGGNSIPPQSASPTVRNCVFQNCTLAAGDGAEGASGGDGGWGGYAHGGAVSVGPDSNPLFENCTFTGSRVYPGDGGNGGSGPAGHGGSWSWNGIFWDWEPDGGYMDYWRYSGYGGAIYCDTNSRPEFVDCTFSDNIAFGGSCGISGTPIVGGWPMQHYQIDRFGGAVYCAEDSSPVFNNCEFSNNQADITGLQWHWNDGDPVDSAIAYDNLSYGGGIAFENSANPRFINCTLNGNIAHIGGGSWSDDAYPYFVDSNFTGNIANNGAGLLMVDGQAQILRTNFIGNDANISGGQGGAIAALGSNAVIADCTISGNNSLGYGAGIYVSSKYIDGIDLDGNDTVLVKNCLITNNTATLGGAGIAAAWHSDPNIVNCTITGNSSAGGLGGGVFATYSNYTKILNSIIWGNSAISGREIAIGVPAHPSTVDIAYSDVNQTLGSVVVDNGCVLRWNGGIISANPLFAGGAGNYYLSQIAAGQATNSPCVDAGIDFSSRFGLHKYTTRTDQVPDVGIVDMGYHYPLAESCLMVDFTNDGVVNFMDLADIAMSWLSEGCSDQDGWCNGMDITYDGMVDVFDMKDFSLCWLYGTRSSNDVTPPEPDPMQWLSEPAPVSSSSITMVAATANDDSGGIIEYQFEETTNNTGGTDSAWQTSTVYTDSGLLQNTQYCYRVRARDEASNITGWSTEVCVSNLGDTNAPTPAPTMIMGPNNVSTDVNTGSGQFQWDFTFDWWNKIVVDVSGITDDSGGQVEVKFICLDQSSLNSDNRIPAASRPIFIDTAVSLGSRAAGYRLTFNGTTIVYDVDTGQFGGAGTNRRWKVCVYDLSGNERCSVEHIIGPPGLP